MAYQTGTATDYLDLLARLIAFAALNGHTILEQSSSSCYMKGTGASGLDEIYWGIQTSADAANGRYNWELTGSVGYRSGRAYNAHPGSSGGGKYIYLWNTSIPYWMVADGRRIILVAKVGTVYEMFYIGFGKPTGTDAQYPYPMVIGGCGYLNTMNYSVTDSTHAAFCGWNASSSQQFGLLYQPSGGWLGTAASSNQYSRRAAASAAYRTSVLSSPDGEYLLDEIYSLTTHPVSVGENTFLAVLLDGIYLVSGYNNSAENIITVDGISHLVFPDIYRSGYGDYFALRLS